MIRSLIQNRIEMDTSSVLCPVCTLYLRNGMRLEDHLQTHPKEKVIEALVSLSFQKTQLPSSVVRRADTYIPMNQPPWHQARDITNQSIIVPLQQSNNQSFFYQQFVSSTATHPGLAVNSVMPHYVSMPATAFNPQQFPQQMVLNPCVYQQQQQQQMQIVNAPIMSLGRGNIDIASSTTSLQSSIITAKGNQIHALPTVKEIMPVQPPPTTITVSTHPPPPIRHPSICPVQVSTVPTLTQDSEDIVKEDEDVVKEDEDVLKEDDDIVKEDEDVNENERPNSPKSSRSSPIPTICLPDITITKGNFSKDQDSSEATNGSCKNEERYGQMEVIPIFHVDESQETIVRRKATDSSLDQNNDFKDVFEQKDSSRSVDAGNGIKHSPIKINSEVKDDSYLPKLTYDEIIEDKKEDTNYEDGSENYYSNEVGVHEIIENDKKEETDGETLEDKETASHSSMQNGAQLASDMIGPQASICPETITPDFPYINYEPEPEINENEEFSPEECYDDRADANTVEDSFDEYSELNDDEDSILPHITEPPRPKIEKKPAVEIHETTTETSSADNIISNASKIDSNNDIVILQNEVICLPISSPKPTTSSNSQEEISPTKMLYPKKEEIALEANEILVTETKLQPYDGYDSMNVVEFDGIKLVLSGELINMSGTTAERNFHCVENIREKTPPVLLNIGEMVSKHSSTEVMDIRDESASRESLNIRADERMPPRGELSEQESNGASDAGWGRTYQECSSGVSTSYDLLARESWEASDCSDSEVPPLQSRVPPQARYTPERTPPRNFKCSMCSESFYCPKERRVHHASVHGAETQTSVIRTAKKRDRKALLIKAEETEVCDNFTKAFEAAVGTIENAPPVKHDITERRRLETLAKPNIKSLDEISCDVCKIEFSSMKMLHKHYKSEHKEEPLPRYKCGVCNKAFAFENKFTEHLRIHPLECTVCCKYFYRRQNMQLHLKRHLGIKAFKCEVCNKGFITKQKMTEHLNIHMGTMPLKCSMCDESFRRHSNLIQHRNNHHFNIKRKRKDFVCHCGEIFHSKKKFLWHSEIHETKPKSCKFCSDKFVHTASLTRHMRNAHNKLYVPHESRKEENVQCGVCKKVYLKSSLDVHLKLHAGIKPYPCNICNKEFATKWNLKLHRWTHAARASKPFKCTQCKSAFIRQSDFIAHTNSHRSVRPYTCNHCGRQFIRKYNCQRHVKEHERDKSYKCNICNKEFHRSYYLKEHLRIHSGDRPFTCHICGKRSATKSNHNKHVRIHHAREPVSTEN